MAEATHKKQDEIEKRLKTHYEKASKDLDFALQEALKKRQSQIEELARLQGEVLLKRQENEVTRTKNLELQHELDILDRYASQLQDNISSMMKDYRHQFESLTQTVEQNNAELERLRQEMAIGETSMFSLKI